MPPTALITGAARRIGRAIAVRLAQNGYCIVVHYNTSEADARGLVAELQALSGLPHHAVQADLCRPGAAAALFDAVLSGGAEPPSLLVNNASVYSRRPLSEETPESLSAAFGINFTVPLALMQEYHARCSAGHIINLLDYRVNMPDAPSGAYALAKKALKDATEALALEWAPAFRVNGIAPGLVLPGPGVPLEKMSPLLQQVPTRRRTTEDEIANAVCFLDATPAVNGDILYLDGGLHLLGASRTGERQRYSH